MQKRAERFNVPVSLESKKAARAARFGIPTASAKGLAAESKTTVNIDKLKERAQRFGLNVSTVSKKASEPGIREFSHEIMMDSFFSIEPKFLLAMRAVGDLSKFQSPISRDLRTSMVAWALGLVLGGSPAGHKDAGGQDLWQEGEEGLHRMLLAFLREDPSAGIFFTLLDLLFPKGLRAG
ncbi:UNVERIFIED_CONTAM: hypothetical protein K2H54_038809 [Gekko kuhli]